MKKVFESPRGIIGRVEKIFENLRRVLNDLKRVLEAFRVSSVSLEPDATLKLLFEVVIKRYTNRSYDD